MGGTRRWADKNWWKIKHIKSFYTFDDEFCRCFMTGNPFIFFFFLPFRPLYEKKQNINIFLNRESRLGNSWDEIRWDEWLEGLGQVIKMQLDGPGCGFFWPTSVFQPQFDSLHQQVSRRIKKYTYIRCMPNEKRVLGGNNIKKITSKQGAWKKGVTNQKPRERDMKALMKCVERVKPTLAHP